MNQVKSNTVFLSVVIPIYNESAGLKAFHSNLKALLKSQDWKYELIYVNDGSTDTSTQIIDTLANNDATVRPINLSRNFGKEAATTAGLRAAKGNAAIILDADGQHPIELIPKFVEKWLSGSMVVVGVRTGNQKEGLRKRFGSKMFYGILRIIGVPNVVSGTTDFRLIDKQVLRAFSQLDEHNRITRALIDWLGFQRSYITFVANPREHGNATYSYKKLLGLAFNGLVSSSFTPLYLSGYLGLIITVLSFIAAVFAVIEKYILHDPFNLNLTGTGILDLFILFLVGILLIGQGLLSLYVARIYSETQNRPLYIEKEGE